MRFVLCLTFVLCSLLISAISHVEATKSPYVPPSVVKPPAIQKGSIVGFISPASPIYYVYPEADYQSHIVDTMANLSMQVMFGAHAFEEFGFLAGPDENRTADVMDMFTNTSISAIVANRGGWGCNRIIDQLNYTIIGANPKIIMGYSDLTGLLNAITSQTGMVTFHGAMGLDDWSLLDGLTFNFWQQILSAPTYPIIYSNSPQYSNTTWTITSGQAKGRLVGGNLSVFTAMMGSIYFPSNFEGTILFLEDVNEQPYQIDRMLTSLHLAGVFSQISGFVFGICTDCQPSPPANQSLTLEQVLIEKIQSYNIPAFAGAMFGHDLDAQFILPIGVMAEIDADEFTITLLENAVV